MEKTNQGIKKIAIIGAESTGKSDMCALLAKHYNTVFVPEFAREYFNTHDILNYSLNDLITIAQQQLTNEQNMHTKAQNYLFCDTTLITIKIWAQHRFNEVPKFISDHIKGNDYDYYLLSNNDIPWVKDPQRFDENIRDYLFDLNERELQKLNVHYNIISGVGEQRFLNTLQLIENHFSKF